MKQKQIAIFGLGISNLSVVKALIAQGAPVVAWDDHEKAREKAAALGAEIKELDIQTLQTCESLILAPGVPLTHHPHPVVIAAQEAGTDIICDIELRFRQGWDCQTIGITGTNGKSTTTALIGHVLEQAGIETVIGGNIGTPIFDLDVPGAGDALVLELSSYQLDLCPTFRPDISILLNITPDHLDRHGTMEAYAAAKARMFEGQGAAVITGGDSYSQDIKAETPRTMLELAQNMPEQPTLKGAHNVQNMQAAYAACSKMGLSHDQIMKGFESFPGLPHRQFLVRIMDGVSYINDSKATNAEAASKALSSYDSIYWIVGGRPKEGGLNGLEEFLPRVRKAYVIGEAQDEFAGYLNSHGVAHEMSGTMDRAVEQATQDAGSGAVLLSPAAASFDQYKNFEARGEHFTKLVEALK